MTRALAAALLLSALPAWADERRDQDQLVLAGALLAAATNIGIHTPPARADDADVCRDVGATGLLPSTHVLCPRATLERVRRDCAAAERDRDLARADAELHARQRDALAEHVAALVALPVPEPRLRWWHVAGAATAGVVLGVVVGLVAASGRL